MAASAPEALPTDKLPNLFSPTTLGSLELRNGLVMSPLTRGRCFVDANRCPNDMMAQYYARRARHSGMIICEASCVTADGEGWDRSPSMYTDEHCEAWKPVVAAIQGAGAKACFQMWHIGRAGHSSYLGGNAPLSASATTINGANFGSDGVHLADGSKGAYEQARAIELEEIPAIIEGYRQAAAKCKEAGFDAIEVHAANGYLINQFLDSSTNLRTDAYGGTVENRARLLSEVVDAVCTEYPSSAVGVRLSPNGVYNDMGAADSIDTFTGVLQMLSTKNLAFVDVMDGLAFGFHQKSEPFTIEAMNKVYPGDFMVNCGYTRDTAEAAIASGNAKAVAIGRPFISNPDLGFRWANGLLESESNMATWFSHDAEGYDDYPDYTAELGEELKKAAEEKAAKLAEEKAASGDASA